MTRIATIPLVSVVLVLSFCCVIFSGCTNFLSSIIGSKGTTQDNSFDQTMTPVLTTLTADNSGTSQGTCRTGLTNCSGNCVDLSLDISNCGMCGIRCTGGAICQKGMCTCPEDFDYCDGQCVSLKSNFNCGECGNICTEGSRCVDGACLAI